MTYSARTADPTWLGGEVLYSVGSATGVDGLGESLAMGYMVIPALPTGQQPQYPAWKVRHTVSRDVPRMAAVGAVDDVVAPNNAGGWISRPEGTRLKQVGNYWIKEVDPNASAIQQWWGRGSLNAQARALDKLGDMATPHLFKNGKLVMRDAGQFSGSTMDFLSLRANGSWSLGTPFNDIWPRNIGANGHIFDPALHPIHEGIYWAGTGIVVYKGGELLYYQMQGDQ
jgi:hypothetical protein